MNFYACALEQKQETIKHRRFFHQTAEIGLNMPQAQGYILRILADAGIEAKLCGHGVAATVGQGGKVLLLRADMDALPMEEKSGLPFACTTGHAHACGHDCHAAMLLTAAKLLKMHETELKGTVRIMFQPAEETLEGCRDMIAHGILEPKPDAALAFHVAAGEMPPGIILYQDTTKPMMHSADTFEIIVTGRGAHSAYPNLAVDPIKIGAHIYLALQSLVSQEVDPQTSCTLVVGNFSAGTANNIIPEKAILKGSVRTNDPASRALLVQRLEEVCRGMAETFGGIGRVVWHSQIPPLICDPIVVKQMTKYIQELPIPGLQLHSGAEANASEDFALIAEQIPSAFFYLSAGFPDARGEVTAHNPKVQFHEDVLPIGTAALAYCAMRWLQENH